MQLPIQPLQILVIVGYLLGSSGYRQGVPGRSDVLKPVDVSGFQSSISHFRWLDPERRQRASLAVQKGMECMLNCQIRVNGELTGWCQQHDSVTFEARLARTFELASICPQETTDIVGYLMHLSEPSEKVLQSTDASVAWLAKVQLEGIRIDKVAAPQETFFAAYCELRCRCYKHFRRCFSG